MSNRLDGRQHNTDVRWMRQEFVPSGSVHGLAVHPEQQFALSIRIKALHHWIRKGNGDKARHRMVECVRTIKAIEKRLGRTCDTWAASWKA